MLSVFLFSMYNRLIYNCNFVNYSIDCIIKHITWGTSWSLWVWCTVCIHWYWIYSSRIYHCLHICTTHLSTTHHKYTPGKHIRVWSLSWGLDWWEQKYVLAKNKCIITIECISPSFTLFYGMQQTQKLQPSLDIDYMLIFLTKVRVQWLSGQ